MREQSEEASVHRPLPSVGIPLLRDELRATRLRKWIVLAVAATLLIGGAIAAIFVPQITALLGASSERPPRAASAPPADDPVPEEPEAAPEPETSAVVTEEPLPDGNGTRVVRRFGDARGFRPALIAATMSGEEADALIAALGNVMDFRRCRPEHEMVVERGTDGRLRRFEYRASITQIYEAVRDDEGAITGRQVEVPVERIRLRRAGTVRTSLGAALEHAGLGRTLVGVFVEVFERDVSFSTHTRAGDTFRIIVDEERIGGEFLRYGTVHAIEIRGSRVGERQAFWFEPRADLADFYDAQGRAVHGGWLRTPLRYDHISSPFDPRRRHPILRRIMPHNGVDYAAATGTPVWAAGDGVVSFVGPRGANGNLVSLRHDNGYETHYAHLSRFAAGLTRGMTVRQRQPIGYVGTTGRSTGPHLHFGLTRGGRFMDPQAELNGPGRMMPSSFMQRYRREVRTLSEELARIPIPAAAANAAAPEPEPIAALD